MTTDADSPDETNETLSREEIAEIEQLFHTRTFEGEEFHIDFSEVCGFITGIICGPQIMAPPMWISLLLGEKSPFNSDDQADKFYDYMERIYNVIAKNLQLHKLPPKELFPAHTDFIDDDTYDLDEIQSWCGGFYEAISLVESWFEIDAFVMMLFPIAAVANAGEGEVWQQLLAAEKKTDEEMRHILVPEISDSLFNLYYFILQLKFGVNNSSAFTPSLFESSDMSDYLDDDDDEEEEESEGEEQSTKDKTVLLH